MFKKFKKKKINLILILTGLFIEIAAFALSNAEQIPWITALISPGYYNATQGLNTLEQKKELFPSEPGFNELVQLFYNKAQQPLAQLLFKEYTPTRIHCSMASLKLSTNTIGGTVPVILEFPNDNKIEWDFWELQEVVETLKERKLFVYSGFIFLFGIIVQIFGLLIPVNIGRKE
jgi:hypothetical protein